MALSYEELAKAALKGGFKSDDGSSLGENYEVCREFIIIIYIYIFIYEWDDLWNDV